MDQAQLHLLVNHAPLFGAVFGFILLVYGTIRKNDEIKRISYVVFAVTALITIPTFLSGHPAEEIVEELPGVSESLIEKHEGLAKIASGMSYFLGVLGVVGLFFKSSQNIQTAVTGALIVFSLATGVVMAQTGHLGGQIRHTEIRDGNTTSGEEGEKTLKSESDEDETKTGNTEK